MAPLQPFLLPPLFFVLASASSHGGDRPLPKNLGRDWLQYVETHTAAYNTPGWQRLLLSIRPWGEVGSTHARLKVNTNEAAINGSFLDDERFSYSKLMPEAYGIGFSGSIAF